MIYEGIEYSFWTKITTLKSSQKNNNNNNKHYYI